MDRSSWTLKACVCVENGDDKEYVVDDAAKDQSFGIMGPSYSYDSTLGVPSIVEFDIKKISSSEDQQEQREILYILPTTIKPSDSEGSLPSLKDESVDDDGTSIEIPSNETEEKIVLVQENSFVINNTSIEVTIPQGIIYEEKISDNRRYPKETPSEKIQPLPRLQRESFSDGDSYRFGLVQENSFQTYTADGDTCSSCELLKMKSNTLADSITAIDYKPTVDDCSTATTKSTQHEGSSIEDDGDSVGDEAVEQVDDTSPSASNNKNGITRLLKDEQGNLLVLMALFLFYFSIVLYQKYQQKMLRKSKLSSKPVAPRFSHRTSMYFSRLLDHAKRTRAPPPSVVSNKGDTNQSRKTSRVKPIDPTPMISKVDPFSERHSDFSVEGPPLLIIMLSEEDNSSEEDAFVDTPQVSNRKASTDTQLEISIVKEKKNLDKSDCGWSV